ncbi:hypothetical protein BDN67DRAFT_1012597 [Paxillus ammoniavirescens]|nr:hypothetical protein BDN67DRAFT_1012597 [Paxillus ammoniavirescens]
MHLGTPQDESTTTSPIRTLHDKGLSGEGQGVARGHRQTVGEEDEVEGSEDDGRKTSNGVEERQSRRGKARDEARDDEDGQETREVEGTTDEGEEQQTAAMNANTNGQYTSNEAGDLPPEPPPFSHHPAPPPLSPPPAPPSPSHPERHHDLDATKSNTTAAQRCADALHDPGGQTVAPGSVPPSVRLEGERNGLTSLNVGVDDVETNGDHVKVDHKTQKPPRGPVGTQDGDMRCPNEPTEPPDDDKGARRGKVESRIKPVETKESRRGDEPRGRGVEEMKSKEVEVETGDQNGVDDSHRDGRMNDTGRPDITKYTPGPHTPHPSDTTRPTHLTNPPQRRGRLKSTPTNVSQPEHATETVQGYWGSVPEPPYPRTKGTKALFYREHLKVTTLRPGHELTTFHEMLIDFVVLGSCGKLPTDIGMLSGGCLTADQWLLLSTVYGPIVIPQLWSASLPQDINPEILCQHVIMIQKLESEKQEQANRKANYKKALEEAKKLGKEAHEAEKARIAQEKLELAEMKKQEKLQAAASKRAEKIRLTAAKKAKAVQAKASKKRKAPCDELPDETNPPENDESIPEAGEEEGKFSLHPDDPVNFLKLCSALRIFIKRKLTDTDIETADNLIHEYDLVLITLYGSAVIKPNHHFATHVGACSRNFGPLHDFWTFLFEHLNKVLKSYKTNNHANGELETTFFQEFQRTCEIGRLTFSLQHHAPGSLPFEVSQIMLKASNEEHGTIAALATLSQELDDTNEDGMSV